MSKYTSSTTFQYTHIVWICVAIAAVCVVAYCVFQQCHTKKKESFTNSRTTDYISPLDILPGSLSAATCAQNQQPYSGEDSKVGMYQSIAQPSYVRKTSLDEKQPCTLNTKTQGIVPVVFGHQATTDLNALPLYAFKCAWAKHHSTAGPHQKTIRVTLKFLMHMYYVVDNTDRPVSQYYTVQLSLTNKWTSFIPIPASIIAPKMANTAKIYAVEVSRTDTNHDTLLGIEAISLVRYKANPKYGKAGRWQDFISKKNTPLNASDFDVHQKLSCKKGVYQDAQQHITGTRESAGILLFEPLVLLSAHTYMTTQHHPDADPNKKHTPSTPSKRPSHTQQTVSLLPKQNSFVATIQYDVSGSLTHKPMNTKQFILRLYCSKAPTGGQMNVYLAHLNKDNVAQKDYFQTYVDSDGKNTVVADIATSLVKHVASQQTLGVPDDVRSRSTGHTSFTHSNIGVATLANIQDNVLCECTVALSETTDPQAAYVFATDANCEIKALQYVHLNTTRQHTNPSSLQPITLLQNKTLSASEIVVLDNNEVLHTQLLHTVFSSSMIDADSSILRFERHPTVAATPMLVCVKNYPMSMNDGFAYYGSLLVPQQSILKNNNHVFTLTVTLSSKHTLVLSVTRENVLFKKNGQLIHLMPLMNQATDYSWYVYVYKDTFCLLVNNEQFNGQSAVLTELYENHTKSSEGAVHAYDPIMSVQLQLEPTFEVRSRFVSAITYKPSSHVLSVFREDQLLLEPKACVIVPQRKTIDFSKPLSFPTVLNIEKVVSYDNGTSVQFEVLPENIRTDMYTATTKTTSVFTGEVLLFQNESIRVALQKRPTKRPSPQFFYLVLYFRCGDKYNGPLVLAEDTVFTTKYGMPPKIVMKYSCYKNMERFCVYNHTTRPELLLSKTHKIAKKNQKRFKQVEYNSYLVKNLLVSHRTMSTNCNPYNTSSDCDCTGIIHANPSNQVTNFECHAQMDECVIIRNSNLRDNAQVMNGLSENQCLQTAYQKYGSNMLMAYTDNNGVGKCAISDYPAEIVADNTTNTDVHTCKYKCDQLMRVENQLFNS